VTRNQQAQLPLLWLICAANSAAYVGYTTLPFLMGVLSQSGVLSLADAGTLGSLELAAMAITALVLAPKVTRVSPKKLAFTGAAIAISAHLLSGLVDGFEMLMPLRILAGLGEGALIATAGPLPARSSTPEKLSAKATLASGLVWALVLSVFPLAVKEGSQFMAFAAMAMIVAACLPLLLIMPSTPHASHKIAQTTFAINAPSLLLLGSGFIFAMAEAGVWSLNQNFATKAGVKVVELGPILGVVGLIALAGSGLAAFLGLRFNRAIPITVSIIIVGLSHFTIITTNSYPVFITALVCEGIAIMFAIPFLYGFAVELDKLGRLATLLSASMLLGRSAGPIFASYYLSAQSYGDLGAAILIIDLGALVFFLIAIPLSRKHRRF